MLPLGRPPFLSRFAVRRDAPTCLSLASLSYHQIAVSFLVTLVIVFGLGRFQFWYLRRPCSANVPASYNILYRGRDLIACRPKCHDRMLVVHDARDPMRTTPHSFIYFPAKRIRPAHRVIVEHVLRHNFRTILLLGLGGASISYSITESCDDCFVTGVDNSTDALTIARKFVKPDEDDPRLAYVLDDAKKYVRSAVMQSHDAIIADLGVGTENPGFLYDSAFIDDVHRLIRPGGQFIVNLYMPKDDDNAKQQMTSALSGVFALVSFLGAEERDFHFTLVASK